MGESAPSRADRSEPLPTEEKSLIREWSWMTKNRRVAVGL